MSDLSPIYNCSSSKETDKVVTFIRENLMYPATLASRPTLFALAADFFFFSLFHATLAVHDDEGHKTKAQQLSA